MMDGIGRLTQDLRFAVRGLRKSPGFAAVAILVLALGTGANTAIFSIFHAVLLRPLPFHDPDRVMLVTEKIPSRGVNRSDLCAANFYDLQQRNQSFVAMAILSGRSFTLTGEAAAERISGALVSPSFFNVFRVSPARGRGFRPEDDDAGAPSVAVLSYELWQRRFAGDVGILGKNISLNGRPHQIVGVIPRGFQALSRDHEIWVPMQLAPAERSDRTSHYLLAVGRLKAGVTPQHAQADLDAIASSLEREYPKANTGRGLRAAPLREELVGETRPILTLLMGAVSLVLLAACMNVANLLLARALSRKKEIGIRLALGAGVRRLLQQLLIEGLLLAVLGIGVGLLVAFLALRALTSLAPAGSLLAGLENVPVDGPVLFMQAATAALISAFFACMPAWQLFRGTPVALSERSATAAGGGGYRVRGVLLAVEVAFSLVLVLGAGLVLRSFTNLMRVEPGFQPERILTVQLQMPPQQTAFFRRVEEQVRAIPGVENVAAIEYLPLSGSGVTRRMLVDGRPRPEPGNEPIVQRHIVTTDYFRAMGIPLRSSRAFRDVDMQAQRLTVVINEAMARRYWQNQNPVGQYLKLGTQATVASAPLREVVGVVGDVRHSGLRLDAKDEVYVPLGQDDWPVMNLIVRTATANPAALIPELKKAVWALDKNQPLPNMKLMTKIVADSVWQPRLNAVVLTAFAAVSLVLALAGIYGLTTRIVGDRTPEIGVRMAMGASPLSVLLLILRQGFIPVLIGGITGLALAGAGGRLVATQLYGVTPADPITLTASVTLIICSAFLAMAHPALRAARVDPMTALRHE